MIPVIICGGLGSKMWPLSTPQNPKHFLKLIDGKSLFQINWEVLRRKYSASEIYLQTNAIQAHIACEQVPEIVKRNIFIEPETKNQGPATGFAAAMLKKLGKTEPFMLVQADDLREPKEDFIRFIDAMDELSKTTDKYITAGYLPKRVVLGCDYLLTGDLISGDSPIEVYEIAEFVDRSETEKIKEYLNSGRLVVHSNHTTMTPDGLLNLYKKYRPEWYEPLMAIANGGDIQTEYQKMPRGTLEEVSKLSHRDGNSLVMIHPFEWIDFGTWEFVSKFLTENGIFPKNGGNVQLDGENNFLWSESGLIMATVGVSDLIVVETKQGILVTTKEGSGKINKVVERINSGDV